MKKLVYILLSVCFILKSQAQLVIYIDENGTPYTIDKQASSSVIDMDAFDAFLYAMKDATQKGDADLINKVKALCKTKYNPSEIKKAKNHEMQAYLARCYELGVVNKQFGYNYPQNSKKAYNYYYQAIGGDYLYHSSKLEQVAYRMGLFLYNHTNLHYEIKGLKYENIMRDAGHIITRSLNADNPFYGYKPKAYLAARIVSGEETISSGPVGMYMYNDRWCGKVRIRHPDVFQEAIKCYNVAADGGSPEVQTEYAAFLMKWANSYGNGGYYYGEGYDDYYNETVDYRGQGLYWYKMAALQDYCPAIVNYSYYSIMLGDYKAEEVRNLLQKASSLGDTYALYNLAVLCYSDEYEMKDISAAFKYASKGAEMGNSKCAAILAHFYEKGIGTAIDKQKAFYYYKQAADAGIWYSAYKTGEYYADKNYGNDINKAFEYWSKTNGYIDEARLRLADCYENGIGTIMDKAKAKYYRDRYKGEEHITYFSLAHYDIYLRSAIKGDKLTVKIAN